jgi:hypothetical protein
MPCIPLQPVICPEVAKDYPSINSEASSATVELDGIVVGRPLLDVWLAYLNEARQS